MSKPTRSYRESSQAWRLAIQHGDFTYIDSPDQAQRAEIDSAEASKIRIPESRSTHRCDDCP